MKFSSQRDFLARALHVAVSSQSKRAGLLLRLLLQVAKSAHPSDIVDTNSSIADAPRNLQDGPAAELLSLIPYGRTRVDAANFHIVGVLSLSPSRKAMDHSTIRVSVWQRSTSGRSRLVLSENWIVSV